MAMGMVVTDWPGAYLMARNLFKHQLEVIFDDANSSKGAPTAGYLLAAYGGEHSTLNACHPAIFYALSMALGAAGLVITVRLRIDRRQIAKL